MPDSMEFEEDEYRDDDGPYPDEADKDEEPAWDEFGDPVEPVPELE